jgi:hypothetical protein
MTEEQVKSLKLGLASVDDKTVLMVESAIEWVNANTLLNIPLDSDHSANLPANVRLFISKYVEVMDRSAGVSSESVGGLSQSFDSSTKTDLLWQYADELLSEYLKSQMSFVSAKARWSGYGR